MVNRDRHDIVIEIMKKTARGKYRTELMREVGLSFSQSKQYLRTLLEKGLLETDEGNRLKTTEKGMELLEKCEACPLFNWDKQNKKPVLSH